MRSTTKTPKSSKPRLFLRLFLFSSLIVACYLVGFFVLGPAYRKMTSTQDLRVQSRDNISMPRYSSSDRLSEEPPVHVTERKLPPRELSAPKEPENDNDIRLEIEQPVSEPSTEPQTQVQDPVDSELSSVEDQLYRVEAKGFADEQSASLAVDNLSAKGYTPVITKVITDTGTEYRVQVGAFKNKDNADRVADDIRSQGYQVDLGHKGQ